MDRHKDEVVSVLLRARKLIEDPARWCRRATSGEAACLGIYIGRASAQSYFTAECFSAALALVVNAIDRDPTHGALANMLTIGLWNDAPDRTHAEVLAALDRAIELRLQEVT